MKKFNLGVFIRATVIFIVLIFIGEMALYEYETHQIYNLGWKISAELVSIFRFPTLIFFWKYLISNNSVFLFVMGTSINCAFYGFIIERIFYLLLKKSKIPPVPTGI
jgi:hypothetical protein